MRWLLIAVVLLALPQSAEAQTRSTAPSLMGYRLGETWSSIGRAMPCQPDSLPPDWALKVKHCLPSGGTLALWFLKDTLYQINYNPFADSAGPVSSDDTLPADVLWSRRWKQWSIARFGEPDSVVSQGTNPRRLMQVIARWRERWGVIQVGILSASASGQAAWVEVDLCGERARVRCASSWLGLQSVAR